MLFKNALKVASATALWMVALLGANSAMAQTMLPTYSAETLTGAASPYAIELPTTGIPAATVPVNEEAQFALQEASATDVVWIRVAATGVLRLPAAAPTVTIGSRAATPPGSPILFASTGLGTAEATTGGNAYIYPVNARGGQTTTDPIAAIRATLTASSGTAPDDAMVTGIGAGGFTVSVHTSKENANFGREPLVMGGGNAFMVASSVRAEGKSLTGVNNVASAVSRFTSIKGMENAPRPYEINLGGFDVNVTGTHLRAADGATLDAHAAGPDGDITEVSDNGATLWVQAGVNGTTRFYGAGGWDFAQGFRLAAEPAAGQAACSGNSVGSTNPGAPVEGNGPGVASSPLSKEDPTPDVIAGVADNPWYLCVSISNENEATIPAGSYSVDIQLGRARGDIRPFPAMAVTGNVVGAIAHDGVTVQIPYVTSYDGYTQRIVIVNRNKVDVSYALTFHAEGDGEIDTMSTDDVTCMDHVCEGMAMGSGATVLKVADVATFMNPTRASATLTVASDQGFIDVATTQVNKMDQSTDTVVLK